MNAPKEIYESALQFIESKEMRDELLNFPKKLDMEDCTEIVCRAPAPLEKKIPVLDLIVKHTPTDMEFDVYNPIKLVKEARNALEERNVNTPGMVFMLTRHEHHEQESLALSLTYNAAMRYIKDTTSEWKDNPNYSDTWFSITKWIPGEDYKMEETFRWVMNYTGDIWFFDNWVEWHKEEGDYIVFSPIVTEISLPTSLCPFDFEI
jgi:hypothetical protein